MTRAERRKLAEDTYSGCPDPGCTRLMAVHGCIDCQDCENPWLFMSEVPAVLMALGASLRVSRPQCTLRGKPVNFLDSCDAWEQRKDGN